MWLLQQPIIPNVDWISKQTWWIVSVFNSRITTYQYVGFTYFMTFNRTMNTCVLFHFPAQLHIIRYIWNICHEVKLDFRQLFTSFHCTVLPKSQIADLYVSNVSNRNFPAAPSKIELTDTAKRNMYIWLSDFYRSLSGKSTNYSAKLTLIYKKKSVLPLSFFYE